MNIAIILAAGVGQRMRSGGLPKQFLKMMGKPIIIYTLEKFEQSDEIDEIIVVCHGSYVSHMEQLLLQYSLKKVKKIVVGGSDRQSSLYRGLEMATECGNVEDTIVVIHDGVRPLVNLSVIHENIRVAKQCGGAMTVRPVTESVVITEHENIQIDDFKKRTDTYSLTSPQTFQLDKILNAYQKLEEVQQHGMPLLDAAMVYAEYGGELQIVKEQSANIKITTPEDFYYLRAILELEETKYIFGL